MEEKFTSTGKCNSSSHHCHITLSSARLTGQQQTPICLDANHTTNEHVVVDEFCSQTKIKQEPEKYYMQENSVTDESRRIGLVFMKESCPKVYNKMPEPHGLAKVIVLKQDDNDGIGESGMIAAENNVSIGGLESIKQEPLVDNVALAKVYQPKEDRGERHI